MRVLRLITASPIEEKILATANEKLETEAKIIEAGKFNQTSDASERRETLQKILSQSADESAEEYVDFPVPSLYLPCTFPVPSLRTRVLRSTSRSRLTYDLGELYL